MLQYIITRGRVEPLQCGDTPPAGTVQFYTSKGAARDALKAMIRNDACRTAYSKGAYTSAELRFLKPVAFTTDLDWYMFCACVRPDFRDQEQSARDSTLSKNAESQSCNVQGFMRGVQNYAKYGELSFTAYGMPARRMGSGTRAA